MIISGSHNDELHLKAYTDGAKHETTIKSFKLPFGSEEEGIKGDVGIVFVQEFEDFSPEVQKAGRNEPALREQLKQRSGS